MGDPHVGKTSIIRTFMEGRSVTDTTRTNKCADFHKQIQVNDGGKKTLIKLNIWDAAGDNDIHNLAHLYLRGV